MPKLPCDSRVFCLLSATTMKLLITQTYRSNQRYLFDQAITFGSLPAESNTRHTKAANGKPLDTIAAMSLTLNVHPDQWLIKCYITSGTSIMEESTQLPIAHLVTKSLTKSQSFSLLRRRLLPLRAASPSTSTTRSRSFQEKLCVA